VPGGAVEQREDGVEVAVGRHPHRAAERGGVRPALLEVRGLPDLPQHLLGAGALTDGRTGRGQQGSHPPQWSGLEGGQSSQRVGLPACRGAEGLDEERVAADALGVGSTEQRGRAGIVGPGRPARRPGPRRAGAAGRDAGGAGASGPPSRAGR
jgi:hypothetical protein